VSGEQVRASEPRAHLPAALRAQVVVALVHAQRAHEGGVEREAGPRHEDVAAWVGQRLDGELEGVRAATGEHHVVDRDGHGVPARLVDVGEVGNGLAHLGEAHGWPVAVVTAGQEGGGDGLAHGRVRGQHAAHGRVADVQADELLVGVRFGAHGVHDAPDWVDGRPGMRRRGHSRPATRATCNEPGASDCEARPAKVPTTCVGVGRRHHFLVNLIVRREWRKALVGKAHGREVV